MDKELIRNLKAETVGRLVATGVIGFVVWLSGGFDSGTVKAIDKGDVDKNTSVNQAYKDSVDKVNAIKLDMQTSR